jgi:predicted nucleotidyltransferase
MTSGQHWEQFVPDACSHFRNASHHTLQAAETAILARLRTMTDEEFEALPYGSEGLWRKLMHASREEATLEEVIAATKSKRYTRTRIDRMILCAFLGLTARDLAAEPPYVRVLGLTDRGRQALKEAKRSGSFINAGQIIPGAYWETERRIGDLYGLFCTAGPEVPGAEARRRIIYKPEDLP